MVGFARISPIAASFMDGKKVSWGNELSYQTNAPHPLRYPPNISSWILFDSWRDNFIPPSPLLYFMQISSRTFATMTTFKSTASRALRTKLIPPKFPAPNKEIMAQVSRSIASTTRNSAFVERPSQPQSSTPFIPQGKLQFVDYDQKLQN